MARSTKNGERRLMESLSSGITGIKHPVEWIETGTDLGYTEKSGTIHVAYENEEFMGLLKNKEKSAFRLGVFGHELLHQIFTDFDALEQTIQKHKGEEQSVLSTLINLIEDPAIEHQASQVYGGELLGCLRYSIKQIYNCSPAIDLAESPFIQVINALVYFGDIGTIKGAFTSDQSYEAFSAIAEDFYNEIHDSNSKRRMEHAENWLEVLRPLWEAEQKKGNDLNQQLSDFMKQNGLSTPEGNGGQKADPENDDGDGDGGNSKQNGSSDSSDGNNKEQNGSGSTDSDKSRDQEAKKTLSSIREAGKNKEQFNKENAKANALSGSSKAFDIPDDVLQSIESKINDLENKARREMIEDRKAREEIDDILKQSISDMQILYINGSRPEDIKVENKMATATSDDIQKYEKLVSLHSAQINALVRSLRKLFTEDRNDNIRSTSGKYNIYRGGIGTTVKIFDKRKANNDIDDIAVMILVDESGSMRGKKIEDARVTSIILAEAFHMLKIPCYIMGFSADQRGYHANHKHYVTWENTVAERQSLMTSKAGGDNFDSFSIMYGSRIFKAKNAAHKIMFVVSDGAPNCYSYTSASDGLEQTRLAIRDAKKTASVLGIGISCKDSESEMTRMYAGTFTNITDSDYLTGCICKLIRRIVSSY